MVTFLRAVNKVTQPMGPLQSGIAFPSLLPKEWPLIIIDFKRLIIHYIFTGKGQRKICLHNAYLQ